MESLINFSKIRETIIFRQFHKLKQGFLNFYTSRTLEKMRVFGKHLFFTS